jgi:hypothetical protein
VKELPGLRLPDSNAPVSDVTVCVVESSFVHVTLAPLLIVSAEGLNARPFIVTVFWLAVLVCGDDEGLGVDEVHPAIMTTAATSTANVKSESFFTIYLRHAYKRVRWIALNSARLNVLSEHS